MNIKNPLWNMICCQYPGYINVSRGFFCLSLTNDWKSVAIPNIFPNTLSYYRKNTYTKIIYIRCEMTPTSLGGEEQISISGGSQSPIWYSLRQDCRDAQKKYVMQLHDAHLAARMPRHSWIGTGTGRIFRWEL